MLTTFILYTLRINSRTTCTRTCIHVVNPVCREYVIHVCMTRECLFISSSLCVYYVTRGLMNTPIDQSLKFGTLHREENNYNLFMRQNYFIEVVGQCKIRWVEGTLVLRFSLKSIRLYCTFRCHTLSWATWIAVS